MHITETEDGPRFEFSVQDRILLDRASAIAEKAEEICIGEVGASFASSTPGFALRAVHHATEMLNDGFYLPAPEHTSQG